MSQSVDIRFLDVQPCPESEKDWIYKVGGVMGIVFYMQNLKYVVLSDEPKIKATEQNMLLLMYFRFKKMIMNNQTGQRSISNAN